MLPENLSQVISSDAQEERQGAQAAVGERAAGQDGAGRACLPSGRRAAQRCILCTSPRCRGWCCPGAEHRAQGRSSLGRRADQQDEFAASTADLPPRPGAAAAFHENQVPQFPLDRRLVAEPDLQAVSDLGTPERCLPVPAGATAPLAWRPSRLPDRRRCPAACPGRSMCPPCPPEGCCSLARVGVKAGFKSRACAMNSSPDLLTIGDVAQASGKAASSLRYYERIGLLSAPARIGGCRRYPPEVLRTLAIIGTAQRAGLTLEEIRLLLASSPATQRRPATSGRSRSASCQKCGRSSSGPRSSAAGWTPPQGAPARPSTTAPSLTGPPSPGAAVT